MFNLALVPKLNAMAMLQWSIYKNWLRTLLLNGHLCQV